jgi:hypothetical protein
MITIPNGIAINPSYITDELGKKLSVVLPIAEFDALLNTLFRSFEPIEKTPLMPKKNNIARFKGLLTSQEADNYHIYLKQARNEWERDI